MPMLLLLLLLVVQISSPPEPITAENFTQLRSVRAIDFADLPDEAGEVDNGWFTVSHDGRYLAVVNRQQAILILDDQGALVDQFSISGQDGLPATFLDGAFSPEDYTLYSIHSEGGRYYVARHVVGVTPTEYYYIDSSDVPVRVWGDVGSIWVEVTPVDYLKLPYVLRLNPQPLSRFRVNEPLMPAEITEIPSGPENDAESFLRIGRIDAPYAVTITGDNLAKRWDLELGMVSTTAQLDALPGMGSLTPDGRYFAWRDGESRGLSLLDFQTGQTQRVAELEGRYIPFLLLNPDADVIIGVNVALQPDVLAWSVVSGEEVALGEYRACTRQPDLVKLSRDGSALVIGCDQGLDLWRVAD